MENMNKLINRSKPRHLLLLVSVMSLCSSLLLSPSSLFHYFNLYFSSIASQILSHTIDKNCMFLLCNGLLVFVGITRSFSKSDPDDPHHDHDRRVDDDEPLQRYSSINDDSSKVEVKEFMVDMKKEEDEEDEAEGKESDVLGLGLKEEEEEEEEWLENEEILVEENVEEDDWRLSTEQMNKKFDDFIRRMKEDLRIEAKEQLVIVYN